MRRISILAVLLLLPLALSVSASGNDTVDSIMNLAGNIPTSTIFFAVDGEAGGTPIELTPNATTTLSCWGVAEDLDGLDALDDTSFSTVIYADSENRFSDPNLTTVYRNDSCDVSGLTVDGTWNCTYQVQYFAEPSDWTCAINLTNNPVTVQGQPNVYYNDTINTTTTVEELIALYVHNRTVDFGLRAVDTNYTADTSVRVYNEGNVNLDLDLAAFNSSSTFEDASTQAMNCTIGFIPVNYMRFSLVENADDASGDLVSMVAGVAAPGVDSSSNTFDLAPRDDGQGTLLPTFGTTYWAPAIPLNTAGACTGRLMYIGRVA